MTLEIPAIVVLHGACAVVYAALALLILARPPLSRTGAWLAFACAVTAVWAATFAMAWHAPVGRLASWLEVGRSAAWYGFILHLYRRSVASDEQVSSAFKTMGLLALLIFVGAPLLELFAGPSSASLQSLGTATRLGFAICNVLLLENLYFNTPRESRWNINLLCVALGGVFLYDLLLYADGVLFHRLSFVLLEARAPAIIMAAPLIALAAVRNRRWAVDIHVSRDVVFHSFTLIASGIFLLAVALIGEVFRRGGSEWGRVAETSLIFAAILAVAVTLTSGSARSRIKSLVVENFFSNRYDYRREWMRCIDALTAPEAFVALHKRAIRAAAEIVDSPAGALFVRPPRDVAFQWAGSWNMPAVATPVPPGHPLVALFRDGDWIVRLDEQPGSDTWLPELRRSWVVLPLNHFGTVIGFVVLARSRAQFKLDREAYDLLRVIGREIASRVAEQRAMQILTQTHQLREYSQRFAFVIHDIKNVSGQLSMLLTNAEVYADNPDFQRDMLATVRASVGKITRLLSRLQAERQERDHALITPAERLRDLVDTCQMTRHRDIAFSDRSEGAGAAIDPDAFDAVVTHLLNNAAEASPPETPVRVDLRMEAHGVVVDIIDEGAGMAPEFVRDELFRPLRSTKGDGHGIGAYQARELVRDAGGDLLVFSRPRAGTTMRIILPSVRPGVGEPASADA
ncbi:XrtA/PEP-CTERM system histidine kinase PrsK [Acidisphaera sp. S103]|uniref:XrtA/PEP-CTERM system histidine kinase PrsK n=1 Tax=Acidisphaera sp. S103 TaxID=1747223 RepID=UPI00131C9930|nr:XrtA/PEP-CTERM system histidine kinase PrsK [Acidisphaera sp. S103]